jgi:hypothetical protein
MLTYRDFMQFPDFKAKILQPVFALNCNDYKSILYLRTRSDRMTELRNTVRAGNKSWPNLRYYRNICLKRLADFKL